MNKLEQGIYDVVLAARTEGILGGKTKRFARWDTEAVMSLIRQLTPEDRVKAVKEILVSFEEDNAQFRGIFCTMYHELATQICQLFERPKVKLPDNPYERLVQAMSAPEDMYGNLRWLGFNEALQQVKEALEKAGVEVE